MQCHIDRGGCNKYVELKAFLTWTKPDPQDVGIHMLANYKIITIKVRTFRSLGLTLVISSINYQFKYHDKSSNTSDQDLKPINAKSGKIRFWSMRENGYKNRLKRTIL